jgi:hypothetical protein
MNDPAERKVAIMEQLEDLKAELADKPKGYATELTVADHAIPGSEAPTAEIVLLDEEEQTIAFRRRTDPIDADLKGEWLVLNVDELFEELIAWSEELEAIEDFADEEGFYSDEDEPE